MIGPEGGFSKKELEYNCTHISLAPSILRADTAALVALAYCNLHIQHYTEDHVIVRYAENEYLSSR